MRIYNSFSEIIDDKEIWAASRISASDGSTERLLPDDKKAALVLPQELTRLTFARSDSPRRRVTAGRSYQFDVEILRRNVAVSRFRSEHLLRDRPPVITATWTGRFAERIRTVLAV